MLKYKIMYDLMIIGGGPAGYVAAERAGKNGLLVVLFEKSSLGGVCLNEGCIPTKTLLYSAKMYENALAGSKYGVYTDGVKIDFGKIVARKNKVVKKLVAGVAAKMQHHQVEVIKGDAMITSKVDDTITVHCNDAEYIGKNLLICTGSEAFVPPIAGLDSVKEGYVLTNKEILALKEQPASLVVIGGGVIGMEFASLYNSFGTKVAVIEMTSEILGGVDPELSALLREIYQKKGIEFHLDSKVVGINDSGVSFEKDDELKTIEAEKILISAGRKANVAGVGLDNIGVKLNSKGIEVDEQMRTNVSNVYAAGDVTGFSLLAHTASREGEVVVNHICGVEDKMSYDAIPGVVYTNPEIASVGETEASALAKGLSIKISKLPMAYAGRFVAENEGVNGFSKVIVNEQNNQVIGVHLLGNPSSEIIFGACMAIEQKMTISELEKVVFPHPTVSEIFKENLFSI
jgi:dihydrolipoamide dehydrogenase